MPSLQMPAEWETHEGTWLAWPHEKTDWPGKFHPVPWVYAEIIRRLGQAERVHILVKDEAAERSARKILRSAHAELPSVDFFHRSTDRSWTRDFCPIFVRDEKGKVAITNWEFNGWAKYGNSAADNAVSSEIAAKLRLREIKPKVVLEGGSIDVNGKGSMLTTEECLLSTVQQRNPRLDRKGYEAVFAKYLGVSNVLWLNRGIAGDDTHGHVDDLARFVDPQTVVVATEADRSEVNYEPLRENWQRLKHMKDEEDRPLRVVGLPMPEPLFFDGQRLPASYANFYIANGLVLVPTFNDPNDRKALATLSRLFPDREVIGIHCSDLVLGLGTLHCMTQQQIL